MRRSGVPASTLGKLLAILAFASFLATSAFGAEEADADDWFNSCQAPPGLSCVEADVRFGESVGVDGSLQLQSTWAVRWLDAAATNASSVSLHMSGDQADAVLYQRIQGSQVPDRDNWTQQTKRFATFEIEIRASSNVREFVLEGFEAARHLSGSSHWSFVTEPQGHRLATQPESPPDAVELATTAWVLHAESNSTTVTADAPAFASLYGSPHPRRGGHGRVPHGAPWRAHSRPRRRSPARRQLESFLVLRPRGAHAEFSAAEGSLHVYTQRASITGAIQLAGVTGHVLHDAGEVTLINGALELEGRFEADAMPVSDGEAGQGMHRIRFRGDTDPLAGDARAPAPRAGVPWPVVAATGIAFGLAALLLFAIKFLPSLFTRLRRSRLLDEPGRARIHEAIEANPGIGVVALTALGTTSSDTVRCHVEVLRRHGLVRAFKWGGTWRYIASNVDPRSVERRLALSLDPRLAGLVRSPIHEARASTLVARFQTEWGLSRAGVWKVIDRAVAAGLVVKERRGRMAILRTADLGAALEATLPSHRVDAAPDPDVRA